MSPIAHDLIFIVLPASIPVLMAWGVLYQRNRRSNGQGPVIHEHRWPPSPATQARRVRREREAQVAAARRYANRPD